MCRTSKTSPSITRGLAGRSGFWFGRSQALRVSMWVFPQGGNEAQYPRGRPAGAVVLPRRRDVESRSMNQASALMCRNQKHKRQPEINRRHHEEIYRHQLLDVVIEESTPGLGGRLQSPNPIFGDRCLRHLDAGHEQLSVNPRGSPRWVGQSHFAKEPSDFLSSIGSSGPAALPPPIETNARSNPHVRKGRTSTGINALRPTPWCCHPRCFRELHSGHLSSGGPVPPLARGAKRPLFLF
jgi:hypothetical protein